MRWDFEEPGMASDSLWCKAWPWVSYPAASFPEFWNYPCVSPWLVYVVLGINPGLCASYNWATFQAPIFFILYKLLSGVWTLALLSQRVISFRFFLHSLPKEHRAKNKISRHHFCVLLAYENNLTFLSPLFHWLQLWEPNSEPKQAFSFVRQSLCSSGYPGADYAH